MATLSALVKIRIGEQYLIELTNEDATATTIDDTVLDAACDDTIGAFTRAARLDFDTDQSFHVAIGIDGVMFHLMKYKGIDGKMRDKHEADFFGACGAVSRLGYTTVATTSNLNNPRERANSISDMNRKKKVWGNQPRGQTIQEVNGDC